MFILHIRKIHLNTKYPRVVLCDLLIGGECLVELLQIIYFPDLWQTNKKLETDSEACTFTQVNMNLAENSSRVFLQIYSVFFNL